MEKLLIVIKVKPEYRKPYIDIHLNPWKEMLEAIKKAGFINEMIWYFEDQSLFILNVKMEIMKKQTSG